MSRAEAKHEDDKNTRNVTWYSSRDFHPKLCSPRFLLNLTLSGKFQKVEFLDSLYGIYWRTNTIKR